MRRIDLTNETIHFGKRSFLFASVVRGSMTVEAAILLPLFLFLFMNLFSIMEMYRVHSTITGALWQSGRQMTQYAYLTETYGAGHDALNQLAGVALTETYVRGTIADALTNAGDTDLVLDGGSWGVSLLGSNLLQQDDLIELSAIYRARPICALYPGMTLWQQARFCGHAWTGYELSGDDISIDQTTEEMVYVTATGTVYHKNRGCSYLNPSIHMVNAQDLGSARNQSAGKYHACPVCDPGAQSYYYVTDYGEVYHSSAACTSLKRTISCIPISEVGTRGPCSKCGG